MTDRRKTPAEVAEAMKRQADKAKSLVQRDRLLREARKIENDAKVDKWISSTGLKPPEDPR